MPSIVVLDDDDDDDDIIWVPHPESNKRKRHVKGVEDEPRADSTYFNRSVDIAEGSNSNPIPQRRINRYKGILDEARPTPEYEPEEEELDDLEEEEVKDVDKKLTPAEKEANRVVWEEWCKANRWRIVLGYRHAVGIEVTHKSDAKRVYNLQDFELATIPHAIFKNKYNESQPGRTYKVKDLVALAQRKCATLAGVDPADQVHFNLCGEQLFKARQEKREAKHPGISYVDSRHVPPPIQPGAHGLQPTLQESIAVFRKVIIRRIQDSSV